jgi:hypothetical protein
MGIEGKAEALFSAIHVGAGLPAMAAAHPALMFADTPLSRASPLLQVLRLV